MCTSPASPELSRQEQLGCQFDGNVHLPHPSSSPSSQSPSLQSVLPSIKPRHCYTTHSTHDCLLRGPRCGLSNDGAGRTGPDSPHECVTCHSLLRFSGVTDSTRLDSTRHVSGPACSHHFQGPLHTRSRTQLSRKRIHILALGPSGALVPLASFPRRCLDFFGCHPSRALLTCLRHPGLSGDQLPCPGLPALHDKCPAPDAPMRPGYRNLAVR